MSQSSKPAATSYLKVAAKVMRLQRALNRPKDSSSESKGSSTPTSPVPSISAPCTPTSFQHSNGRRLSFNQYVHHHHRLYSNCTTYSHFHQRSEHYDNTLYTLQRRRNTNSNISNMAQPTSKDVLSFSTNAPSTTSSKHHRRSGPPGMYPVISIDPTQPMTSSSLSTDSTLSRRNSLPNRWWKRVSSQFQTTGVSPVQQHDSWAKTTPSPSKDIPEQVSSRSPDTTTTLSRSLGVEQRLTSSSHTGKMENGVLSVSDQIHSNTLPVSSLNSSSEQGPKAVYKTSSKRESKTLSTPSTRPTLASTLATPLRSLTNTSISSIKSTFSTGMPLTDSNMSIQSQMSEASILSAAMNASGRSSFEAMMSQVDKSLAADGQAQLVENAHVGVVAQISFVDKRLIAEPCSAVIETWVN